MKNVISVAAWLGAGLCVAACGNDDKAPAASDGPSRGGAANIPGNGSSGKPNMGDGGDTSVNVPGSPDVRITSPTAVTDVNDEGVIVTDTVKVICEVKQSQEANAAAVDKSSVKILLLDGGGEELEEKAAAATDNDDEYEVEFVLTNVAAGSVGFACLATSDDGKTGEDRVETFLDHGPTIEVISPEPDAAYAYNEPLKVEFVVEPAPLSDEDQGAAVDNVSFTLDGQVELIRSPGQVAKHYALSDFGSQASKVVGVS